MPGSTITLGRPDARGDASDMLPSAFAIASALRMRILTRLNGWPMRSPTDASPSPLQTTARLGVDADRYSFTVSDLYRQLLASLSGALRKIP